MEHARAIQNLAGAHDCRRVAVPVLLVAFWNNWLILGVAMDIIEAL
jgi:hypothetical protein